MAKKQKYYVVWQGKQPGIYTDWDTCKEQVQGVQGAQYKSFDTMAEAEAAIRLPYSSSVNSVKDGDNSKTKNTGVSDVLFVDEDGMTAIRPDAQPPLPVLDALAVDAACSGNPGVMEYQGIYIPTRTRIFHYQAPKGTNNIGEFLAIVHGLSYLKKHHLNQIIYSDSVNAMSWVRQKTPATSVSAAIRLKTSKASTTPTWIPSMAMVRWMLFCLCSSRLSSDGTRCAC